MRTQADAMALAVKIYGEAAMNRVERAARLLEEACELAQVEGIGLDLSMRIMERVYRRPVGAFHQEVGGVVNCIAVLCENVGLEVATVLHQEQERILAKPLDYWRAKHAAKIAAGTALPEGGKDV